VILASRDVRPLLKSGHHYGPVTVIKPQVGASQVDWRGRLALAALVEVGVWDGHAVVASLDKMGLVVTWLVEVVEGALPQRQHLNKTTVEIVTVLTMQVPTLRCKACTARNQRRN